MAGESSTYSLSDSMESYSSLAAGNYIGSLLSVTTNSEIRYDGILHSLNTEDSTFALSLVKAHGTEGRKKDGEQVPPSDNILGYIEFRSSDIKELYVIACPPGRKEEPVHNDPAIIQSKSYAGPSSSSKSFSATGGTLTETEFNLYREPYASNAISYPSISPSGHSGTPSGVWGSSKLTHSASPSYVVPTNVHGYSGRPGSSGGTQQHSLPSTAILHPFQNQTSTTMGMANLPNNASIHFNSTPNLTPEQMSTSFTGSPSQRPSLPFHHSTLVHYTGLAMPFPLNPQANNASIHFNSAPILTSEQMSTSFTGSPSRRPSLPFHHSTLVHPTGLAMPFPLNYQANNASIHFNSTPILTSEQMSTSFTGSPSQRPSLPFHHSTLVHPTGLAMPFPLNYQANNASIHFNSAPTLTSEQMSTSFAGSPSRKPSLPFHHSTLVHSTGLAMPFPLNYQDASSSGAQDVDEVFRSPLSSPAVQFPPYSPSSFIHQVSNPWLRQQQALQSPNLSQSKLSESSPISRRSSSSATTPAVQSPSLLPQPSQEWQCPSQFTKEFDLEAMNQKVNKDGVSGSLGKSSQRDKVEEQHENRPSSQDSGIGDPDLASKSDSNAAYSKDDFFDTISSNSPRDGQIPFSERMRMDAQTFGNFEWRAQSDYGRHRGERGRHRGRHRGGHGGRRANTQRRR